MNCASLARFGWVNVSAQHNFATFDFTRKNKKQQTKILILFSLLFTSQFLIHFTQYHRDNWKWVQDCKRFYVQPKYVSQKPVLAKNKCSTFGNTVDFTTSIESSGCPINILKIKVFFSSVQHSQPCRIFNIACLAFPGDSSWRPHIVKSVLINLFKLHSIDCSTTAKIWKRVVSEIFFSDQNKLLSFARQHLLCVQK